MNRKHLLLFWWIFWIVALSLCITTLCYSKEKENNVVKLTIYNPYTLSVDAEIKCDHNYKLNKFMFHKFINIPAKKDYTIIVPNNLKECQVWPKVKFFGD